MDLSPVVDVLLPISHYLGGAIAAKELSRHTWKAAKRVFATEDRFLIYDPKILREQYYSGESGVARGGPPYVVLADLLNFSDVDAAISLRSTAKPFRLNQGSGDWRQNSNEGFAAIKMAGRVSGSEQLMRVRIASVTDKGIVLTVQRAEYHDQARSNLLLDFDRQAQTGRVSMRNQLRAEFGNFLPPLGDTRLANTLGVALLVYYRSKGNLIPYIVRRVQKVGVFPNGLHCSASGAVRWPSSQSSPSFSANIAEEMLREAKEEVGLSQEHFDDFRAVALCREMVRGGKPQVFFCAITNLTRDELAEQRRHAAKVTKQLGLWEEVERDKWHRSSHIVLTRSKLEENIKKYGVTLEGAASAYFGEKYLKRVFGKLH